MNQQVEQLIAIATNAKLKHAFTHDQQAIDKIKAEFSNDNGSHKAFLFAPTLGANHKAVLAATNGDDTGLQMHSTPCIGKHHKAVLAGPAS
ncbi:hypothetical protein [Thalassomonas haliotis]|uniref:Uncharacterized protein n=1 Tax=Thalassomonas haliotis TaxID=485448 RepID=A0ABY7VMK8_9GAMM|nr:hypothetical protein [Thalassomonas haliotis]WDE13857.1 hypothetical protein H3N35_10690 [Thalassomonas haliotis]